VDIQWQRNVQRDRVLRLVEVGILDMDDIQEALSELIKLGLIEVVGIMETGEWLYGPTPKGTSFVKEGSMILDSIDEARNFFKTEE